MARGPHAELISPYFSHMKSLLVGGIVLEDIDISKLKKTSSKTLYASFTSTFPPPKIVFKFDADWLLAPVPHVRTQGQGDTFNGGE